MKDLIKLEVPDLAQAQIWLKFQEIFFFIHDKEIFLNEDDWDYANNALNYPPLNKRDPDTYRGGRPTLASQGLHTRERMSVSISNEAGNHLRDCQRETENKSQVVDRLILEHKTITDIEEIE